MAKSQRIQVGFSTNAMEAIEKLSEQTGFSLSKVASILAEQSLISRGLIQEVLPGANHLPPEVSQSIKEESAAYEAGWKPDDGDMELLKKIKLLKDVGML